MTDQTPASKFSLRERVALAVSSLILVSIIIYWLNQLAAVAELLQLAYEYSWPGIIGRLVLILLAVGILITAIVFIQRQVNKDNP